MEEFKKKADQEMKKALRLSQSMHETMQRDFKEKIARVEKEVRREQSN